MNVFDFDETIYAGESCVDFAMFFFRKDSSLVKTVPDIAKSYMQYKQEKLRFDSFIEQYSEKFEEYVQNNNLDFSALMEEFWDEKRMKNKIRPFYRSLHRDDDIVISASPVFLIEPACRKLGIKTVVATEFDIDTGKIGRPCFRESKIECLRSVCPEGAIDDFYTDSMNDQFLMPFAKRVFLVKGNKITRIK